MLGVAFAAIGYALEENQKATTLLGGIGACMGLGLFAQAALEHALARVKSPVLILAACFAFGFALALFAFAQAFALPALIEGDTQRGVQEALDIVGRLLVETPDKGVLILFVLGCPFAVCSVFAVSEWVAYPGPTAFAVSNVLAPAIYLIGHEAELFHAMAVVTSIALPLLRLTGDWFEAKLHGLND